MIDSLPAPAKFSTTALTDPPECLMVALAERTYPIHFSSLRHFVEGKWQALLSRYSAVQWITHHSLQKHYGDWLNTVTPPTLPPIVLPDGESFKSWATLETILSTLLSRKLDRQAALVAFGGGVIGDISGFAAGIYQRGIAVIQIPTTLLSMVDSSVGGKTAVNHPLGKNMIGVIHQPQSVWIDTQFLRTLPTREFNAGLAEVIKYGLLGSEAFFVWLENHSAAVGQRDEKALRALIAQSCQMKAEIVARDEHEQGERALLNLGHTFGHAIEMLTDYRHFLHGEAVALGILMAAQLSQSLAWISPSDVERIRLLIQSLGLPTVWQHPFADNQELSQKMCFAMTHDKKVREGKIRFVLLRAIGRAVLHSVDDLSLIAHAIRAVAR